MKIHFTTTDLTAELSPAQALRIKGACGTKTTFTAAPMFTNDRENVDCTKCLASADKAIAAAERGAAKAAKAKAEMDAMVAKLRAQRS